MQELIEEVLLLQTEWSHLKTAAMDRRGVIVRHELPDRLREHLDALSAYATWPEDDLRLEGRDGTGPKTEIPWVRLFSEARSDSATNGWYVVFLFSALGDRCYLTLARGATEWTGAEFKPRPHSEMVHLVGWARHQLLQELASNHRLIDSIALDCRRSNLGPSYEAGTAAAFEYPLDDVPSNDALLQDLQFMLGLLSKIYAAESADPRVPGAVSSEVALATQSVAEVAGKQSERRGGQGYRLTKAEQQVVEAHAMAAARKHLEGLGWAVRDVSGHESYDLACIRSGERMSVEVKGTTSLGESVILTRNEVLLHRREYPATALLVVHSIDLNRLAEPPVADRGVVEMTSPWEISEEDLTPIAYTYQRARREARPIRPMT